MGLGFEHDSLTYPRLDKISAENATEDAKRFIAGIVPADDNALNLTAKRTNFLIHTGSGRHNSTYGAQPSVQHSIGRAVTEFPPDLEGPSTMIGLLRKAFSAMNHICILVRRMIGSRIGPCLSV
jgi:hypothetical protein